MLTGFDKAIAAFLTSTIGVAAALGVDTSWAKPELVAPVAGIIAAVVVYLVPNKSA